MSALVLVSHPLCPYVQRAAIALAEKGAGFERREIDLANKPGWFTAISPLGKVPLLILNAWERPQVLFESTAILEYLEETQPNPLHPADPVLRAQHRAWMEFGSTVLNGIARFYAAPDQTGLDKEAESLAALFARVEEQLGTRPEGEWFAGPRFSLVDAVFGPGVPLLRRVRPHPRVPRPRMARVAGRAPVGRAGRQPRLPCAPARLPARAALPAVGAHSSRSRAGTVNRERRRSRRALWMILCPANFLRCRFRRLGLFGEECAALLSRIRSPALILRWSSCGKPGS